MSNSKYSFQIYTSTSVWSTFGAHLEKKRVFHSKTRSISFITQKDERDITKLWLHLKFRYSSVPEQL